MKCKTATLFCCISIIVIFILLRSLNCYILNFRYHLKKFLHILLICKNSGKFLACHRQMIWTCRKYWQFAFVWLVGKSLSFSAHIHIWSQRRYVILLYIHNCIFYSPTLVKLLYLEFSLSSEKIFTYPFDMQKYRQIFSISSPNDLNLSEILTIWLWVTVDAPSYSSLTI